MRFDPFKWQEVKTNAEIQAPRGRLSLLCSRQAAFFVTAADDHGEIREVLAGVGTALDITSEAVTLYRVEPLDKGARAFVYVPERRSFVPEGEIYTNADRQPMESGTVLEVRKALRQHQLESQALLAEVRRETKKARKMLRDSQAQAEEPELPEEPEDLPPSDPVKQDV